MSLPAGQSAKPTRAPALGMSARAALRLEYGIISVGIFALALIFQPFSLALFGAGCALVVLAGLLNNLLPVCQPGVRARSVVMAGLIVAMIFCTMLLIAIAAAYLYGALFVNATAPDVNDPFYRQPFVWGIAVAAALLACAVAALSARDRKEK
jgi:hypothetical protein